MNPKEPTDEQEKAFEAEMEKEHSVSFKKKELIVLYNILCKIDMKYGDSLIIGPIVKKLEPIVAVDTNIPQNITQKVEVAETNHKVQNGEPVIIGGKKRG